VTRRTLGKIHVVAEAVKPWRLPAPAFMPLIGEGNRDARRSYLPAHSEYIPPSSVEGGSDGATEKGGECQD
jgi:hypothetical protein